MIHMVRPLPKKLVVACSGGVDSMAAVDFLRRKHDVTVAYFNHQTPHGNSSLDWLTAWCNNNNLELITSSLEGERHPTQSQEEFWRIQRYQWFKSLKTPVVTAHHLDDCVETYVFNCLHGKSHTISYEHANVVRPFLTTCKSDLQQWCERKQVPWIDDPSNAEVKYMRNYIRHILLPHARQVNPGLTKVVRKIVLDTLA